MGFAALEAVVAAALTVMIAIGVFGMKLFQVMKRQSAPSRAVIQDWCTHTGTRPPRRFGKSVIETRAITMRLPLSGTVEDVRSGWSGIP